MYQEVTVIGHLGGDPEMRYTPAGKPVANFSVAASRKWTNQDGSKGEETAWFRVSAWGKLAEVCNEYLSKGRQVFIKGQLIPDKAGGPRVWTDRDGNARASFELRADTVKFLGSGRNGGSQAPAEEEGPVEIENPW